MSHEYTLLCTDLVDSTALNTKLGDAAMAEVWAEHDRRSRDLLARWHGREIDRSDGFLVLFDSADDAAAFAADYHRMLAALSPPLRARVGVHTGPLQWRQNLAADVALGAKAAELVGIAKAVSARLMALAKGQQTLISASAMAALAGSAWRRCSHGHWRLKGWDEPVEVFEIGDEQSAFVPPPDVDKAQRMVLVNGLWVGARHVPNNLPAERDGFVGRVDDLRQLARRIDGGARLVTLHGPGGMGKTRMAVRYGWAWRGSFPGGLWFCDLAHARSLDGILQAVAQGLDVPLGSDPVAQLGRAIAGRGRCVVILDNFEQITRHAADTLGRWLDAAPAACFVVTSREVLGLVGEQTLALPALTAEDGISLFHQRASAANAAHDQGEADAESVRALVDLLDRMPLAIELAAPRVRVMTPGDLLARMGDRFQLLAVRDGRPDRHATLRATLEWSWDLLTAAERSALSQLTVFEGGCNWLAIEAVVRLDGCDDAPWLVDLMQSLVEKSLLCALADGRFSLLRSVQEFARAKLQDPGQFPGSGPDLSSSARRRHLHFFAALDERAATARRCIELDNLVLACRRAVAAGEATLASECLTLCWAALRLSGPFAAAVTLARHVGSIAGAHGEPAAIALGVAGMALHSTGASRQAHETLLDALTTLPATPRAIVAARLHCALGNVEAALGQHGRAADRLETAYGFACAAQHPGTLCLVLNARGALAGSLGKLSAARSDYEEALALATAHADLRWQGGLWGNIGYLHYAEGELVAAQQAYERTLAIAKEGGDRHWEGNSHCNLGLILHDQGQHERARFELAQALELARAMGHRQLEYTVECNLGIVCEALGENDAAARHFETAVAAAQFSNDVHSELQFSAYLGVARARCGDFDGARQCLEHARRLADKLEDPLNSGLLWCSLAHAEHLAGCATAAAEAIDCARQILTSRLGGAESELKRKIDEMTLLLSSTPSNHA